MDDDEINRPGSVSFLKAENIITKREGWGWTVKNLHRINFKFIFVPSQGLRVTIRFFFFFFLKSRRYFRQF